MKVNERRTVVGGDRRAWCLLTICGEIESTECFANKVTIFYYIVNQFTSPASLMDPCCALSAGCLPSAGVRPAGKARKVR